MEAPPEVSAPPEVEVKEGKGEGKGEETVKTLPKELPPVPPFVSSEPDASKVP